MTAPLPPMTPAERRERKKRQTHKPCLKCQVTLVNNISGICAPCRRVKCPCGVSFSPKALGIRECPQCAAKSKTRKRLYS